MRRAITRPDGYLTTLVLLHLVVAFVHGRAHEGASVAMSTAGNAFVLLVIIIGPLAGLIWSWLVDRRSGDWIVAATMAGSLVFGVVNHFVLQSPDHVSQVDVAWRGLFGTTAVLLACIETIGSVVGAWQAVRAERRVS